MNERSRDEGLPLSCHVAVLVAEVLQWLCVEPGQTVVDGTVGGGGTPRGFSPNSAQRGGFLGWIEMTRCSKNPDWFSTILGAASIRPVTPNSATFCPRQGILVGRLTGSCWTSACHLTNLQTTTAVLGLPTMVRSTSGSTTRGGRRHGNGWLRLRRGSWSSVCGCGGKRGTAEGLLRGWFNDDGNLRSELEKNLPRRLSTPSADAEDVVIRRHGCSRRCGSQSMTSWSTWSGRLPTRCRRAWPPAGGSLSSRSIH